MKPIALTEPNRAARNERVDAEFGRLELRAFGELGPRHPRREAEVVLDPCRGSRLATQRHGIQ